MPPLLPRSERWRYDNSHNVTDNVTRHMLPMLICQPPVMPCRHATPYDYAITLDTLDITLLMLLFRRHHALCLRLMF